jgi:hypothetical protein
MTNPFDCDADGTLQSEMLAKQEDDCLRDDLGRIVREVWVSWAQEQPNPKASWLVPYDQLNEPDREVDRRIGERLFREGLRSTFPECKKLREQLEYARLLMEVAGRLDQT